MKETYITEDEQLKCQKVANAFAELYEIENILVLDAGRYGLSNCSITDHHRGLRM